MVQPEGTELYPAFLRLKRKNSLLAHGLRSRYPSSLRRCLPYFLRETLNQSSTVAGGSFPPNLRFEKLEIHKVSLRFPNLALTKNLSPSTLVDWIRASLEMRWWMVFQVDCKNKALQKTAKKDDAERSKRKHGNLKNTTVHKKKRQLF